MQKTTGDKMNAEQINAEIDRILGILSIVKDNWSSRSVKGDIPIPSLWEFASLIDRQQKHEEILRKLDEISKSKSAKNT